MRILLENIFSEFKTQNIGYPILVSALLQQCVIMAIRCLQKDLSNPNTIAKPAHLSDSRAFITDKAFLYEYNTLTLKTLSSYLGLSDRQTERYLKKQYKKSFSQKLLDARMSAAAVFLSRPNLSLLEIAEKLGYSSVEYFSDVFKRYYLTSPRKYRHELQNKES